MKAEIVGKNLVITVPLTDPTPSASGKTLVVASSHGNKETDAKINGKPVIIGLIETINRKQMRGPSGPGPPVPTAAW